MLNERGRLEDMFETFYTCTLHEHKGIYTCNYRQIVIMYDTQTFGTYYTVIKMGICGKNRRCLKSYAPDMHFVPKHSLWNTKTPKCVRHFRKHKSNLTSHENLCFTLHSLWLISTNMADWYQVKHLEVCPGSVDVCVSV